MNKTFLARTLIGLAASLTVAGASAAEIWALSAGGELIAIDTDAKKVTGTWKVKGADTALRGIDVRPANGQLYAVGDDNMLYTIDPKTAQATAGAKLSTALPGKGWAVVSFNPVADRLRLIAPDGSNFRVNVDSGEVMVDKKLSYAADGAHAGKTPKIVAGAYTNAYKGSKETALYDIDAATGRLFQQAPPNDGVLVDKAAIAPKIEHAAFDIWADGKGANTGFVLKDGVLHTLSLPDFKATEVGRIEGLPAKVIDIAVPRNAM